MAFPLEARKIRFYCNRRIGQVFVSQYTMSKITTFLQNRLTSEWVYRLRILRYALFGKLNYCEDGLATVHNADFTQDPRFVTAYHLGEETGSWGGAALHWRAYIACWAAAQAVHLPGDFVECGVNRGGLARTVMSYVNFANQPKNFYLLDTFQGLAEAYISAEERALGVKAGGYEECYDAVVATFRPFNNVHIIRGTVPDTLTQVNSKQVCYLSIDMNCVEPEIAAINFFWDKLVTGAVVVLDDYGGTNHTLQKQAFDHFASEHNITVLTLPTGQGLIVKL